MKKLLIISVICLSGCSTISSLWPKSHDPVMFDNLVLTKIAVDKLNCDDKNWSDAENKIHHLAVYADLRKDPQAQAIIQLQEAVGKARDSKNKLFCENVLKINRTRIDVVVDAWRGR
jgi:hypothetical protein